MEDWQEMMEWLLPMAASLQLCDHLYLETLVGDYSPCLPSFSDLMNTSPWPPFPAQLHLQNASTGHSCLADPSLLPSPFAVAHLATDQR